MRPLGLKSGDIPGLTPSGICASGIRSNACCRAKYGSVSYWKFIVTDDRPYSEIDRSASSLGMPFISTSSGIVIRRSTSSAACPGHCVTIWTLGGARSG